jgi:LysR family transcriptional regulator, glycine cleavage system transcriptional activator
MSVRSLSRIKAIQSLEATARLGSYVAAAAELNVTPAAVGQQVRLLEDWVGMPLFKRLGSGSSRLMASPATEEALVDFAAGLDRLDAGLHRLRERTGRTVITVTASQALVAKWLLPRLESFTSANPELDVRLDVTDRTLDLTKGDADIGLRCGPGQWPGLKSTLLMKEEIFPVASPALFDGSSLPKTPAQLLRHTLLHDVALQVSGAFPSWEKWLEAQGIARTQMASTGLQINASAAVIQAAINGQGIALARAALVRDDLAAKRLVRLCPKISWPLQWAYYVVASPEALSKAHVRAFQDWLLGFKPAA